MFLIQLYFLLHFILMHYKCPLEMYVSSGTCHGHCVRICECGWTPPAERRENPIVVHWQHLSRGEQQICPGHALCWSAYKLEEAFHARGQISCLLLEDVCDS